jgi:hypothetical protein
MEADHEGDIARTPNAVILGLAPRIRGGGVRCRDLLAAGEDPAADGLALRSSPRVTAGEGVYSVRAINSFMISLVPP